MPKFKMYLAVTSEAQEFDTAADAQRAFDKWAETLCDNEELIIEICELHEIDGDGVEPMDTQHEGVGEHHRGL